LLTSGGQEIEFQEIEKGDQNFHLSGHRNYHFAKLIKRSKRPSGPLGVKLGKGSGSIKLV